jgi:hypothetical protein
MRSVSVKCAGVAAAVLMIAVKKETKTRAWTAT